MSDYKCKHYKRCIHFTFGPVTFSAQIQYDRFGKQPANTHTSRDRRLTAVLKIVQENPRQSVPRRSIRHFADFNSANFASDAICACTQKAQWVTCIHLTENKKIWKDRISLIPDTWLFYSISP